MFKQPKHHIKVTTLMLPLPTEVTIEEKANTNVDQRHPMYH